MRETYRKCPKCKELQPLLKYFISKEENEKLTKEEKQMCFDCYREDKGYMLGNNN